jgi:hypothetical protein
MFRSVREAVAPEKDKKDGMAFVRAVRDEGARSKVRERMASLLESGMTLKEVLDMHAGSSELLKRAEYREVLDEALLSVSGRVATASLVPGINDWWHMSAQEGLKQGTPGIGRGKDKEKKPAPKPFNLKRRKEQPSPEPLPIEGLLIKQRDPSQSQKPIETLLRESQV